MKGPLVWLTALVLMAGLGPFPTPSASGQASKPKVNLFGTESFRLILHQVHLKPLKTVSDLNKRPEKTLLIVFGDSTVLREIDEDIGVQEFLNRGGALLIASEYPSEILSGSLLAAPDGAVIVNRRRGNSFQNNQWWPFVVPVVESHAAFRGVDRLVTNAPSYIRIDEDCKYRPLASFLDGAVDERRGRPGGTVYAIGNAGPTGSVLMLAGEGVFFNGNILGSTANFTFARNCIAWLMKTDQANRDRVLFVEKEKIHTKLDVPLKAVRPPIPPVEQINRLIRGLDEENRFNIVLLGLMGNKDLDDRSERLVDGKMRLAHWAALVLSALLVFFGARRFLKARYRFDSKVPLVASHLSEIMPRESVTAQRHRAMLLEGNLWESARGLARQCFTGYVESASSPSPSRPLMTVTGGGRRARSLARLIDNLWKVAYGTKPIAVSGHDLMRLAKDVEDVKVALGSGILRLQEGPTSATAARRFQAVAAT